MLLDELLEFSQLVLEGLREPIESGHITVSRRGASHRLPAKFQLVATTNLCPCGNFVPGKPTSCRFSLRKCKSTVERLSGPLLDRFDILAFSHGWGEDKQISLADIASELKEAFHFQKAEKRPPSRSLEVKDLEKSLHPDVLATGTFGKTLSLRRQRALLRVARSVADLECAKIIDFRHLEQAHRLSMGNFMDLEQMQ